jgi:hypothetical protein
VRALPFIGSRGARTLGGAPTGGSGDLLNNVHTLEPLTPRYKDLPSCSSLDREVDVRTHNQGVCRLTGTVPAVSDMHNGRRAVTVGSIPTDRRRGYVDPLHRSLCAHCSSARRRSPAADHNYPLLMRAAL